MSSPSGETTFSSVSDPAEGREGAVSDRTSSMRRADRHQRPDPYIRMPQAGKHVPRVETAHRVRDDVDGGVGGEGGDTLAAGR